MEAKHTPPPWCLEGRTVYALNDQGANRFSALVQDCHAPAYELNANAQLIAAVPELLEALQSLILFTKPTKSNAVALNRAHQVVALATLDANL